MYGTVLPWLGSRWRDHPSAGGVAFGEALAVQSGDWARIRRDYPLDEFFVLGDLNQDMVSPPFFGAQENRAALERAFEGAHLVALTAGDGDPVRRDSAPQACVDHICARRDSNWRAERTVRWPDTPVPDNGLSDHFGFRAHRTNAASAAIPTSHSSLTLRTTRRSFCGPLRQCIGFAVTVTVRSCTCDSHDPTAGARSSCTFDAVVTRELKITENKRELGEAIKAIAASKTPTLRVIRSRKLEGEQWWEQLTLDPESRDSAQARPRP